MRLKKYWNRRQEQETQLSIIPLLASDRCCINRDITTTMLDHKPTPTSVYVRRVTYAFAGCALLLASWSTSTRVLDNLVLNTNWSRDFSSPWEDNTEDNNNGYTTTIHRLKQLSPSLKGVSSTKLTTNALKRAFKTRRYHDVLSAVQTKAEKHPYEYYTAYSKATVIEHAGVDNPWFEKKKICKETCCFENIAISLDQDEHNIINTLDGHDLSDVVMQHYASSDHLEFFGPSLTPEIAPCLQPGTIISLENHQSLLEYFRKKIRPNITEPYIVITSESDGDSPDWAYSENTKGFEDDELLLKWYGTNPHLGNVNKPEKFVPMPLGLAKFHRQYPYLYSYLEINNFTNSFQDYKETWKSKLKDLENATENLNDFMFVKFNVHDYAKHRGAMHNTLCFQDGADHYRDTGVSCSLESFGNHDTYAAGSHYMFGISPPGAGWDCYRTYELLLTGVIPIIEERPGSRELYEGLPVIHVPDLMKNTSRTREDFVDIMRKFIRTAQLEEEQKGQNIFNNKAGWERLFLKYWRMRMLKETGRDAQILTDPETGRQYYQAYRYTTPKRVFCSDNCKLDE